MTEDKKHPILEEKITKTFQQKISHVQQWV